MFQTVSALVEQLLGQIEHLLDENRRQTPDGALLLGELPASLNGGHFGPELRRYALYQHHHCHVTQPLLYEQLREWHELLRSYSDRLSSSVNDQPDRRTK